jgi:pyruvate/2-oxoglutarate dehydrogenase complex dihydrolipoamide acyltransferase (E2) component
MESGANGLQKQRTTKKTMATEFTMPMLGEVMEEGHIVAWRKQEGDPVRKGEILMEVETDKAIMEVESTVSGVLKKILVPKGQTVPVNTPLALIE